MESTMPANTGVNHQNRYRFSRHMNAPQTRPISVWPQCRRMANSQVVPSAPRFCWLQPTLTPNRLVTTKRVCQSICNGACSVEKTVSPTTPTVARARPPKARRRSQSNARSISASTLGRKSTAMQMMKIRKACAVPLRFRYGVKAWTVMFDRPVYFWYQ